MGKLISIVAVVVLAMFLLPAVALAQVEPPVCTFYGNLEVDGAAGPVGTVVSAWIDDAMVASATTTSVGLYAIKVVEADTPYGNKTVAFRINDRATGITSTWEAGDARDVPLTVGEGQIVPGVEIDVVPIWAVGNSTLVDNVLTLYLGPQPTPGEGEKGDKGDKGDSGEDATGGTALPIVALVIAIIAAGVAMMSMRRRV